MNKYKEIIENELKKYLNIKKYNLPKTFPNIIFESMSYTTLLSAKRLRAILCLETCKIFSGRFEEALPVACAIEMLHSQSLIHDDLPSMDNDDLRRGKPSNHKVYGEAVAILAGDALISLGAQVILENVVKNKDKILKSYLESAGALGIVGGQVLDITSEGKKIDFETLQTIHKYKTGTLFECAVVSGALCADADETKVEAMRAFAQKLGIAFQIYDDILDEISTPQILGKTTGKDKQAQKATYTTLFGLDKARKKLNLLIDESYAILGKVEIDSKIFGEILELMREKTKR